ncbi:MAG: hypothetical protein JO122_08730 [Acetobacteraceae bacterium]|nr:hypothetical protein [Acetobacteraceae bacterium]
MRFRVVLVLTFCACSLAAYGVGRDNGAAQPGTNAPATDPTKHYPDEGLLSNYRYANAFFGFAIDLPADAGLRPIPTSNPADGSIALLETLGSSPYRSVIAIFAYTSGDRAPGARLLLRHELDEELSIGVEELHSLSKTSISGHQFFYYETRRGIDQHAIYATDLDGYVLRFIAAGRDAKMVQQLEAAVSHMRFFPPESVADYIGVGAKPYNGPAIPYHIIEQLKSDPPARKLGSGSVSGNVYENSALGFGYELPKNWHYGTEAAVMPAVEHSREQSYERPAISPSQRALLKACEKTLVSAWRKMPEETGQIAYEDFGEVTISAMSLACFPNIKFPDLRASKESLSDFMVAYGLGHPILQDMRGARAFEHEGRTFIVMDGVVAYRVDGDALSRRVSVALALTEQRGFLISFFFAAPHDTELHDLMNAKAAFDPEPALKEASTTGTPNPAGAKLEPGGSVAAPNTPPLATRPASLQTASVTSQTTPSPSSDTKPPADATSAPEPTAAGTFHPSLLRPGETMKDQQMQGAPVPKK